MPYETRLKEINKKNESKIVDKEKEQPCKSTNKKSKAKERNVDLAIKNIEACVPAYNVTKKVIIVFDRACDEIYTDFKTPNGHLWKPIHMLIRGIKFFLHHQSFINNNHEFALILLNENICEWEIEFTKDINEILNVLEFLEECETEDVFNMTSVFDTIMKHVELPKTAHISERPPYVIQTIFLYNRSFTTPEFKLTDKLEQYLKSPYFTFDILYTHEVPEANNHCQKIIDIFRETMLNDKWYFFPVAREAQLLHTCFGRLLSHPLQRQKQGEDRSPNVKI